MRRKLTKKLNKVLPVIEYGPIMQLNFTLGIFSYTV